MNESNEEKTIIDKIASREGFVISKISSLQGGSINTVFLLHTGSGKIVLKLNKSDRYPRMFEAEKKGLDTLRESQTMDIPKVHSIGDIATYSYLLLEYKKSAEQHPKYWDFFAEKLAALHQVSSPNHGFPQSNYIGSLPQYNEQKKTAAEFYLSQRLEPQLRMASENGFSFKNLEQSLKNIERAIPEEPPALLHGDLWSGNYLVNEEGLPCLIDPATSYGPREMDLSMMKLFGGFPAQVFSSYAEIFPLETGFEDRVPLWQLYYLLVHLNIFGRSYLAPVQGILNRFA